MIFRPLPNNQKLILVVTLKYYRIQELGKMNSLHKDTDRMLVRVQTSGKLDEFFPGVAVSESSFGYEARTARKCEILRLQRLATHLIFSTATEKHGSMITKNCRQISSLFADSFKKCSLLGHF